MRTLTSRRIRQALGLVLLASLALAGCDSAGENGTTKPLTADAQIKAIENNPHMPAEMKEQALARLRQGKEAGETAAKTKQGAN